MTARITDDHLLPNVRLSREAVDSLVRAWIDDVLERRVDELFDAGDLARAAAAGIREVAANDETEELLERRITIWLGELRDLEIEARPPGQAVMAVREILKQPYVLDEDLVAALLDHEAAHILLRDVLRQALFAFSAQVASLFPGGELAFWLVDQARGIVASAAGEVGSGIEERVNEFVDEALDPAFKLAAERIANQKFAEKMGDWRGHVLDVLLEQPRHQWMSSLDQVDPGELAGQFAAFLQGVARWEQLEEIVRDALVSALDRAGNQSLRSILSGSLPEESWRPALEKQLADAIWPFLESQGFANWLTSVIGSRPSGGP
ncbi:MAG: M56 family metallopeptidase [Gammaproteobacteria bacterium]|nr:M56 family metallopeptidase [Gammaproteobacteria bacterium]